MNPQHADANDALELDVPLFMTDKVVREVHEGRAEMVGKQKKHADVLKSGGRSGVTRDFGKIVIDDAVACKGTTTGADALRHEAGDAEEKSPEAVPPDVAELLVRVLSSPEFESLLDQPVPTMLWTPETAGQVSDELSGACLRFRVAQPEPASEQIMGTPSQTERPAQGSSPDPAANAGERPAAETSDVARQLHQTFLQEPGVDETAWAKRLELRLLLERPGKPADLPPEKQSGEEEKSLWANRPRIRRTLERPAILADVIEKAALEKQSWTRPKLRGTLERPAVLEEMIQKEAERQSWAKRPKLRTTLEHPGNIDDILRDARALFLANLTAASTLYGRGDHTGGDAAVDKAIFQLVRPGGLTESGVPVAPIILATIDGILFEYGKSSDESDEAASDRRPLSLNLAQYAQMNILATNAAGTSARLVAESGRALVKPEEMSNLTSGVSQMVQDAISSRANSIQHASIVTLARAAAREDCAEQLVVLVKQNVRDAIETESRETLKQTIKSVSSVQDQPAAGTSAERDWARVLEKPAAEKDEFTGASGASSAKQDELVLAKESAEKDLEPFEKPKSGALPEREAAIVAGASAEAKRRSQSKQDEHPEIEPVAKKYAGLEIGGVAAAMAASEVAADAAGLLTFRMLGRSGPEMAQLGELLSTVLTKRQFLARLTAACNALSSGSESAAKCTKFDIPLDGFGTGETVLVVLAKDEQEALMLQAQMTPQMADAHNHVAAVEGGHQCSHCASTKPVAAVDLPSTLVPLPQGSGKPVQEDTAQADRQPGDSAWDAFKLGFTRLFGKK